MLKYVVQFWSFGTVLGYKVYVHIYQILGLEPGRSRWRQHALVCSQQGGENWAGATQATHPGEAVEPGQELMRIEIESARVRVQGVSGNK